MSEISQVIHQIEKNKNLEFSLARFANQMASAAQRLSSVRLVMNYDFFYEKYREEKELTPSAVISAADRIAAAAGALFSEEKPDAAAIDALRKENIGLMQELTSFSDVFVLYEYIMNRVEYRFRVNENLPKSDELFIRRLMNYITSGKDAQVVQYNAVSVVAQLPFRMTKGKFLQTMESGLSVYNGAEMASLDGAIFNLKSAALLDAPAARAEHFPELYAFEKALREIDDKELDEAGFLKLEKILTDGFEILNRVTDFVMLLQEVINDCYVIALCGRFAGADADEAQAEKIAMSTLCGMFAEGACAEIPESLNEQLDVLVGRQEQLYVTYSEGTGSLPLILEAHGETVRKLGIAPLYEALDKTTKLLTNSYFIELDGEEDHTIAGEARVSAAYAALAEKLLTSFEGKSKLYRRAVMSKILTSLPLFLRDYEELSAYVSDSITNCRDEAEKAGCMEVLQTMMNEAY